MRSSSAKAADFDFPWFRSDAFSFAACAPEMIVRLLLYGYANGVYGSRKIEKRTGTL